MLDRLRRKHHVECIGSQPDRAESADDRGTPAAIARRRCERRSDIEGDDPGTAGDERFGQASDAASRVELLSTGVLNGDLKAASLTVAAGSRMRGNVSFGWDDKADVKPRLRVETDAAS